MSLATYAGLQASVAATIGRSDTATYVTDWIALAEARIGRELRVDQMLSRTTSTLTGEFGSVPADFLAPRSMRLTSGTKRMLDYLTIEQMADLQMAVTSGPVQAYSRINNQFWFYPPPTSETTELIYYAAIPALSGTVATNWLLTSHPDVYLRATMLEAALFYEDEELVQTYSPLFSDAIGAVMAAARRDTLGANIAMTPSGFVV